MRCSALTAKGDRCKSKATDTGYCKRHAPEITPSLQSAAERKLRAETERIVARVRVGSDHTSAFGASGYQPWQSRRILTIAAGGDPDVTDDGYRAACEQVAAAIHAAQSERDGELAAAWRETALADWRAAQAFLERRSADEWTTQQRVSIDADVRTEHRSDDAVLEALKRLTDAD